MARSLPRFLLGCALGVLLPASAEAQVLRFGITTPGKVIGIGNTLGLSKGLNENGPGIKDSIGTFLSLGNSVDDVPADAANPWGAGTTYDWTKNGSNAVLTIPTEAKVIYAELVWGGSTNYGGENVTALLDNAVTLTAGASTLNVAPDPATSLTIAQQSMQGFAVNYYMRSADVTAFVKAAGTGMYAVSGVPATEATTINSLNAAGWTLVIAVRDTTEPVRNLSVFVGGSFVDENSQQDYTVSGFCTPPAGEVQGDVIISAIEGDANLVGDQLQIGPTAGGPFVGLSGPNNPANNFFCSQINDATGALDTKGTHGTVNHDAASGTNVSGGRQGWDVTTIPLSSQAGQLQNGQTSAVLHTITTGDSYVPIVAAFAIDVNAPDFTTGGSKLTLSASSAKVGDQIQATLDISNNGQVPAQGVKLVLALEAGLSLAAFTLDGQNGDVNNQPVTTASLGVGVDAGDLDAGAAHHVVLSIDVVGPPQGAKYVIDPTWQYGFQACVGGATTPEEFGQFGLVTYSGPVVTSSAGPGTGAGGAGPGVGGGDNGDVAGVGGGVTGAGNGAGGSDGSGDGSGGSSHPSSPGSCGCSLPGDAGRPWVPALLALAGAALLRARRRA